MTRTSNRLRAYLRMERAPGALPELDGLRALAIVLVLLRHGVRPFVEPGRPLLDVLGWDVATPFLNGWMGVDLFFVLSGFLITSSLLRHRSGRGGLPSLGPYLRRRVLRIVPTYYAVLFVVVAGLIPAYHVDGDLLAMRVGYHLLFLQDYLPSNVVVAFWSLGVEEKFYLTAPMVFAGLMLLRRPLARYLAVGALIGSAPLFRLATHLAGGDASSYEAYFRVYRSPFHLSLDALYVGVLAALIYRDRDRWAWATDRRALRLLFVGGAVPVAMLLLGGELLDGPIGLFDRTLQPSVLALGFGAMLLALALGGGPRTLFSGLRSLVVSKLAYSLYLIHMTVIPGCLIVVDRVVGSAPIGGLGRFAVFLPLYLVSAGVAAGVLFYAVERPFLIIKDRSPRTVARPLPSPPVEDVVTPPGGAARSPARP